MGCCQSKEDNVEAYAASGSASTSDREGNLISVKNGARGSLSGSDGGARRKGKGKKKGKGKASASGRASARGTMMAELFAQHTLEDHDGGEPNEIAKSYQGEVAILVTDMTGFTRLTKKMGIVHFASLILKMRQLCSPIFRLYNAMDISTEADNFFVVFPNPADALAAALEVKEVLRKYNAEVGDEDFMPKIGGYGLATGSGVIFANSGRLFGEVFDVAFHLGEDVAGKGDIMVDQSVYEAIKDNRLFSRVKFKRGQEEDDDGGLRLHYTAAGPLKTEYQAPYPPPDVNLPESTEAGHFINSCLRRLENQNERATIDRHLHDKYMREYSIVVLGIDLAALTEKYGVMHSLQKMAELSEPIDAILEQYNGHAIEEIIFAFTNPTDALLAAMDIKAHFRSEEATGDGIPFKGLGVHVGDMLLVHGTNVHWGDPLNTASKLGEDVAEQGELFLTDKFYDKIKSHIAFKHLTFERNEFELSHVIIPCYSVADGTIPRDLYGSDASRRSVPMDDELEAHVKKFSGKKAVVVTDMSGFTRITRKMGIVHFASLIMKMRQLLVPLWEHYRAIYIETEADNFFVIFPDVEKAVAAALQVYQILDRYNSTVENEDWMIKIGGIGVGYGGNILEDKVTHKLYGPTVDSAFNLGEDVASGGEVLVDEPVYNKIKRSRLFAELEFQRKVEDADPDDPESSALTYFNLLGNFSQGSYRVRSFPRASRRLASVSSERDHFMSLILRRVDRDAKRSKIDAKIAEKYMRPATVVMYGIDWPEVTARYGVLKTIQLKQRAFAIVKEIVEAHNGDCVEETLWVFYNNSDAFAATLEVKAAIVDYNETANANDRMPLKGFGVHTGELLVARGTDVHWGDPVNTASKLGEDLAEGGELFISRPVHDAVRDQPGFTGLHYEARTMTISKVELQCYCVT